MPLPAPENGLVLCYEFLWSHEHQRGEEYGTKRRPCAVVLTAKTTAGQTEVVVAPITHRQPRDADLGVEIPARVKQHLGLDSERSWIVVNELNRFVWPGLDLYPIPGGRFDQYDYGFLPPALFDQVIAAINKLDETQKRVMRRTA